MGRPYRSNQWEEEAGAHASFDVPHWNHKACGHALPVRLVRQGQVGLRHADWQVAKALKKQSRRGKSGEVKAGRLATSIIGISTRVLLRSSVEESVARWHPSMLLVPPVRGEDLPAWCRAPPCVGPQAGARCRPHRRSSGR